MLCRRAIVYLLKKSTNTTERLRSVLLLIEHRHNLTESIEGSRVLASQLVFTDESQEQLAFISLFLTNRAPFTETRNFALTQGIDELFSEQSRPSGGVAVSLLGKTTK